MRSSSSDNRCVREDSSAEPDSGLGVKSSLRAPCAAGVKVTCAPDAVEAMRRGVAGAHPVLFFALHGSSGKIFAPSPAVDGEERER